MRLGVPRWMWRTSRIITSPRRMYCGSTAISPDAIFAMPSALDIMWVPAAISIGPF